jgi:GntR family transcriptional regulator
VERISESLLAELTGGVLAPGTPLAPERELAERLRVSPRTVRAAVNALIDAGYLVRRGPSGAYVTCPDPAAAVA